MKKRFRWKKTRNKILQIYIRIILGLIICAATISTIYIGRKPYGEELKEGDVSLGTIYAPVDFNYEKEIDEKKTKLGREKAAAAIDEIYQIDSQITQNLKKKLDKFFNQIVALQTTLKLQQEKEEEKIEVNKSALPINISEGDIKILLAETDIEDIRSKTKTVLTQLLSQGIISIKLEKKLAKSEREFITLRNPDTEKEKKVPKSTFLTLNKAEKKLTAKMQNLLPENRKLRIAIINLLEEILQPNVTLNEELTKKRRQAAYDMK
jgi:membrane-associated HD superfamily phosphohydrolase